ncbi:MAG: hypothetical protein ACOYK6_00180 [Chthoniobacterales bacterium]
MINSKKKQIMEMGESLQNDHSGQYRTMLCNRVIELRRETELKIREEKDHAAIKCLEALMRALIITDRILDKLLVSEPHEMNSQSRAVE